MKKNAGKITVAVLLLMACMIIVYIITPAFAVVRSYDQDVQTISMTSVMTSTTDDLFDVSGGAIEIISFFGQVTTNLAITEISIEYDADAGTGYDGDFTTAVDANGTGAGDIIRFTDAIDEGIVDLTANVGSGQTLSWFCPEGMIEQTLGKIGTGAIKWYMSYRKLDSEAVVTAQ